MRTICAISTAMQPGAIAIIRMSGANSFAIAKKIFRSASGKDDFKNKYMYFGRIYDEGDFVDEVLICFMKAPNTYTTEDMVEIYSHGSVISQRRILNLLLKNGAELAERGEFTKKAFIGGRIDITQAEAVADMINAKTDMSYNLSLKAFDGSVRDFINGLADSLKMLIANIEVAIDYPEEDIEEISYERITNTLESVKNSLEEHIRRASTSTLIKDGIKTSIVGVPNVGKSSLLNTFTREETAIVSNIEGTTRDMITEYIDLDGISLKLMDTAGIREASDEIERMGVAISKKAIKDADLVLAVFDYSKPMSEGDKEIIDMVQEKKHIYILNKVDEGENGEYLDHFEQNAKYILTSLKTGEGFEALKDMIKEMFLGGEITQDDLVYANIREMDLLNKAHSAICEALNDAEAKQVYDLLIVNIRGALDSLLEILGEKLDSEILDKIFQNFCIGK